MMAEQDADATEDRSSLSAEETILTPELSQALRKYWREVDSLDTYTMPDGALIELVEVVNDIDALSFPVTLLVHGQVFSGDLISAQDFMGDIAAIIRSPGGEVADALARPFDRMRDQCIERQRKRDTEPHAAVFIHLRNATAWDGSGSVANDGSSYRIRLIDVSGWSLGKLARSDG